MAYIGEGLLGTDLSGIGAAAGGGGGGGGALGKILGAAGGVAAASNPVGAAAMAALAVGKGVAGLVKRKQADKMIPQMEDPEERALASYAARRKRAFMTGTATASARNALRESMKTGIEKSIKVGGGAKGLNMMTRMFNQGQLGLQEKELAGEKAFFDSEREQKTRISQRKVELGLLKRAIKSGQGEQTLKEGKSGLGLGLAKMIPLGGANPYGEGGMMSDTTGTSGGVSVGNEEG